MEDTEVASTPPLLTRDEALKFAASVSNPQYTPDLVQKMIADYVSSEVPEALKPAFTQGAHYGIVLGLTLAFQLEEWELEAATADWIMQNKKAGPPVL